MSRPIQSAAVLGAGVMGAQIAGHLANAGLPVTLLDITREAAIAGLERLRSLKPDPLFVPDAAAHIRPGGFDELQLVAGCDWIVEAIVEDLGAKQELLARLEPHRSAHAIVSSNTSAISLASLAAGRGAEFRRHWLGTHFFNPPRYLRLVEIIPTPETDSSMTRRLTGFLDRRLGKGIVIAKDSPGFIANRIGVFGALRLVEAVEAGEFKIEEIDAITGQLIGRPKSATFRTLDIAGLDVFARVAADLALRLPEADQPSFRLPGLLTRMIDGGRLGAKTGRGFYTRVKADGESAILVLDVDTLEYRPAEAVRLPELEKARAIDDIRARLRALFNSGDRVGQLLRRTFGATLVYAARVTPDIAHSIDDVDRAMRWGFGWAVGPFETMDAMGVGAVLSGTSTVEPPELARAVIAAGRDSFRSSPLPPAGPGLLLLDTAKRESRVVKRNGGASLVDLGDGVLCVEFHSKMNAIGGDAIEMLRTGVQEAGANFAALVVGNEAEHFSAGANLMLLLLEAQEENWDEIDAMVRAFQGATMALKASPVPVVAAPGGLALGGGCEVCLHADRVQAAAETYMGLVETGVGLIPAGGGTKEMLLRALDAAGHRDATPHVQEAFMTMAFAKVSSSAADATRLGYLRDVDAVTMNRERLIADAKDVALERARLGYVPAQKQTAVPVGGADLFALLSLGVHLARRAERISDHDALVARKLAWVLAGGNAPHRTTLSEDDLLDLEREAFLSLCGEPKTQERIGYTLKTGKSLRN